MNPEDVARKTEKAFCGLLTAATPDLRWVPGGGPDGILSDDDAAKLLTPPYAVFAAIQPEEILSGSGAYQIQGRAVFVSDMTATSPEAHSQTLRTIKDALDQVQRPQGFAEQNLILNGFDILGPWEKIDDEDNLMRCHALPLSIGASG